MARSRNIKPGFFESDELADCGIESHLLFAGLWTIADKEGRIKDRPRRIEKACLPYYKANVDECLDQLWNAGFILRYEVDGSRYLQIQNWHKHQSPHHKEAESELPEPSHKDLENKGETNVDPTLNQAQDNVEPSLLQAPESVIRNQESKKRESSNQKSERFESFWSVVPKKIGVRKAEAAFSKAIELVSQRTDGTETDAASFLVERMGEFALSPKARGKYCPHPSTWLNEGRYDDDPVTWQDGGTNDDPRSTASAVDGFLEASKK